MTSPVTSPVTSPDTALLEARQLSVHFGAGSPLLDRLRRRPSPVLRAVDGVDLEVRRGEALAIVGESGSGKSTLARALVGLTPVNQGEVRFEGRVLPARRARSDFRRIQLVFQDPYSSLNPRMTVGQVLRELLRVHQIVPRSQIEARVGELVALVGLSKDALDALPHQFSGGQRQRVAIARALALNPDVLVADEPVSALDVSVQATIVNLLENLRAELGLTLLFVAHNLAVVRHLCDRVAVMYLGRIVEIADTEDLFGAPQHPYTQGLLAAIPRLRPISRSTAAAVQGDPPSPLDIPTGCRFRSRCPVAQPRCSEESPLLITRHGAPSHLAACHFVASAGPPLSQPSATSALPGWEKESSSAS